jgi:hypothetical protein
MAGGGRAPIDAALVAAVVVLLIVVVVGVPWWRRTRDRFSLNQARPREAELDGYPYRVQGGHPGAAEAADRLAQINARTVRLLRALRRKYARGAQKGQYPARAAATQRLLSLYNPDNIAENSPRDPSGDTSYTVDKGAVLALCLRGKGPGTPLHPINLLTFVALHELTHIAVTVHDHPPEFWIAFKWLLAEAAEAGVYRPEDFRSRPQTFCGTPVDYNPLFDAGLPEFV